MKWRRKISSEGISKVVLGRIAWFFGIFHKALLVTLAGITVMVYVHHSAAKIVIPG